MPKYFKIITLGCKVNQYESAFIEESLMNRGCIKAGNNDQADFAIINGCIVTAKASYQTRQAIRRAIRENPDAIVSSIGCYGQVFPDELSDIQGLDLITGNRGKKHLPDLLMTVGHQNPPFVMRESFNDHMPFEEIPVKRFSDRTRAFLKLQDGCESFCTYCIIPKARGPLRSLRPEKIITSLKSLKKNGYKEIVLTGINLGKYGSDFLNGNNLSSLLRKINTCKFGLRIRLSSLNPTEVTSDLIELMKRYDWLCRHFHVSLQSGDDLILKRMNRRYNSSLFTETVYEIYNNVPDISIGVDVLTGFPGEDDTSFNKTFTLLEKLPISYLHVFPYSRRKGTAAAAFLDQVDNKKIKKRVSTLKRLDREKRGIFWSSLLGKTFSVLTEGWAPGQKGLIRAISDNYVRFMFPSKKVMKNNMISVRADQVTDNGIIAHRLDG